MSAELTIVVPTYNEKENVRVLSEKLNAALFGVEWEVIFVDDDSPDGTSDVVREISAKNSRVRCLQRVGRRGLSSACIEGILASSSEYVAVMDADLQHDETVLPIMLESLRQDNKLEVVVGSRYVEGGGCGEWTKSRKMISAFATKVGQKILCVDLKDPMSGFFMVKRTFFSRVVDKLNGKGFKILLDIFASSKDKVVFKEVPYTFKERSAGESKLDFNVSFDYGIMILDKLVGEYISIRFVMFFLKAFAVLAIHYYLLLMFAKYFKQSFVFTQLLVSLIIVMLFFMVRKTTSIGKNGVFQFLWEAVSFSSFACIGVVTNVSIAFCLYDFGLSWVLSGLVGGGIGALWNYISVKQVLNR